MRSPLLRLVPVALSLFSAACGSKGGSGSDSAGPADPNTVVVNEMLISLGGERLGPSPEDKLAKHDALFDKLKERREQWKMEHPDSKFQGVLTLDLGPSVTVLAALLGEGFRDRDGSEQAPHFPIRAQPAGGCSNRQKSPPGHEAGTKADRRSPGAASGTAAVGMARIRPARRWHRRRSDAPRIRRAAARCARCRIPP